MASPTKPRSQNLRFHAVSIVPGADACAQVKSLAKVRLLSLEAPRLPIVGCANPDSCRCRFEHHDDRRAGPRRSGLRGSMQENLSTGEDRRRSRGRRASDYAED
jgi:hypothetical protein